jgi:hypothetical protein
MLTLMCHLSPARAALPAPAHPACPAMAATAHANASVLPAPATASSSTAEAAAADTLTIHLTALLTMSPTRRPARPDDMVLSSVARFLDAYFSAAGIPHALSLLLITLILTLLSQFLPPPIYTGVEASHSRDRSSFTHVLRLVRRTLRDVLGSSGLCTL